MHTNFKKSLYIFLCALLGAMLFLILHRILVFAYLALLDANFSAFSIGFSYFEFLALDYCTLIFALLAGELYGIWLGVYWYQAVYEQGTHGGLVGHMLGHYWPAEHSSYDLKSRVEKVAQKVEHDLWELESLAETAAAIPQKRVVPKKRIARKIVRKV